MFQHLGVSGQGEASVAIPASYDGSMLPMHEGVSDSEGDEECFENADMFDTESEHEVHGKYEREGGEGQFHCPGLGRRAGPRHFAWRHPPGFDAAQAEQILANASCKVYCFLKNPAGKEGFATSYLSSCKTTMPLSSRPKLGWAPPASSVQFSLNQLD